MNRVQGAGWLGRCMRRFALLLTSSFVTVMTLFNASFASITEFNIVITPDSTPIVWPKDTGADQLPNYGEPELLSSAELLSAEVCLTSALCTVQAINAGAVYYREIYVPGVGVVVFYYDEYGQQVFVQARSEITGAESQAIVTENLDEVASLDEPELPPAVKQYFGAYDQYEVGTTKANFEVDHSGAANYEIPIYVPPGVGDMQPELSIRYHSQGGNGLLGMGFQLSGLSQIGRCPKTRAQDGITRVSRAVDFTNNDAFCLDGQRLLRVSGTHGETGAEYRTEIESFSRVRITSHNNKGPLSFEVKTKAGQTLEYGATSNSRVMLKGHQGNSDLDETQVMLWAVESIADVAGNRIDFEYQGQDDNNTAHRPHRISYGAAGYRAEIVFSYTRRFDARTGYVRGYRLDKHHRW